jgi:hypothetical protein
VRYRSEEPVEVGPENFKGFDSPELSLVLA